MHIVLVGCGRVGSELAIELEHQGHTIGVIDRKPEAFSKLPKEFKGRRVLGFGFDRHHLEEAGIREAGALAAVTRGDNTNIVSARVAHEYYGIQNVVARIYDPRRALIFERLGIPTVASVRWATDQALRRLFPEEKHMDWVDPTGGTALVEWGLPSSLVGLSLDPLLTHDEVRLVTVTRMGEAKIAKLGTLAQEGDVLQVVFPIDKHDELEAIISQAVKDRR